MNLCIIVKTNDLKKKIKPPKYHPKVCYKLGDKSILEVCLDNFVQLNPKRIILMVSKNEIQPINRCLKYLSYAKLIVYCIFDDYGKKRQGKYELAKNCYEGYNILVVPGNVPLLTSGELYGLVKSGKSAKIDENIYYLNAMDQEFIDNPKKLPDYLGNIPENVREPLETQTQYRIMLQKFVKKQSWTEKLLLKLKSEKTPK